MVEIDRVVERQAVLAQDAHVAARRDCRFKNDLLKRRLIHVVGAGAGQQE